MNIEIAEDAGRRMSARRDIVLIVMVGVVAAVVCAKFNLSEALLAWTQPYERLQLDELPAVLLVVAISLVWFSSRRYFEATRQLRLREAAEAQLAETLVENKRLAQRYLNVQEHERKALARDLHDELGQYLNAIKLDAVSIREAVEDNPTLQNVAGAMLSNIDRVYGVVTGLIRQLRPVGLDDLGVVAALEHCVNDWRSRLTAASIDMSIDGTLEMLDEAQALVVYRLVQEALTNVARHAKASCVRIRIAMTPSGALQYLETIVADNGVGTDLNLPHTGLGLVGMRERVAALGGSVAVQSAPGAGFEVRASLPMR
jgi:two-component system sensor histidine kinase UhpB